MSDRIQALIELERRGKLPAQFVPALAEARKRGLVSGGQASIPQSTDRMAIMQQRLSQANEQNPNRQADIDRKGYNAMAGGAFKANLFGDADPTTQNPGEKLGALLNKGGESMTAGLIGDEASAGIESLFGADYEQRRDHYRNQEEMIEQTNPKLSLAADIGGAMMVPGGGLAVAGAKMVPKMAAGAAMGGAYGGVSGFMEGGGDLSERMQSAKMPAALGMAGGVAAPAAGSALNRLMHARLTSKASKAIAKTAPSSDGLRKAGNQAYQAVDDLGVQIKPEAFEKARGGILDKLRNETGFDELPGPGSLTPKTARVSQIMEQSSNKMAAEPTAALPFKSLDQMRRQAGAAAGNITEKADQQAGMKVIEGLDDFVGRMGPDDVVAGDVQALPGLIEKARTTWQQMSKSQMIDDAMDAGENYRYGASNGIKNQFNKILKSPKLSRGFSEAEKAAMKRVTNGTIPEKFLEAAGSGLTQVGGLLGATLGAPSGAGAALMGLGVTGASLAARAGSNAVTKKNAEIARGLIASGRAAELPALQQALIGKLTERGMLRGSGAVAQ